MLRGYSAKIAQRVGLISVARAGLDINDGLMTVHTRGQLAPSHMTRVDLAIDYYNTNSEKKWKPPANKVTRTKRNLKCGIST